MATPSVYAAPGTLWLTPTSANGGGTQIRGIEGRNIEFDTGRRSRLVKSGMEADAWKAIAGPSQPPILYVPLRGNTTQALATLFQLTKNGTGQASSGAAVQRDHVTTTRFSIALRPKSATLPILYSPYWQLHPDNEPFLVWHPTRPRLKNAVLKLFAGRPPGGALPAWMEDAAATIDAAYFPGGGEA